MKTFTLLPSRKNQDNRNLCICIITAKKDSRGSIRFCMGRTPALCSHWPCSRYHSALEHCVCLVDPSCLTLCDPLDYSPPGSSVQRILQARILERVAIPFFRESSWPRGRTQVSCTASRHFTVWASIYKMKAQPSEWEKIFANEATEKGLISKKRYTFLKH